MKKKLSVGIILLVAISLVLISSVCFADINNNFQASLIEKLVGQNIDINNLSNFFKQEYLNEYDNKDIRVIVEYKENKLSIDKDLKKINVDCSVNYNFNSLFYGQSITIKIKDLLSLTKLDYISNVYICANYVALNDYTLDSGTNGGVINNTTPYTGENMVVCVIDNAFDTSHSALSESPASISLTTQVLDNLIYSLNAYDISNVTTQELYLSDKIPFAYDYAEGDTNLYEEQQDHGTHVAGIIAGNNSEFSGVVKDAQLVLMKVGDANGVMYTDTILKALEDSQKLDVDAVNMSLGSMNGFTYNEDDILTKALDLLKDSGIDVICAAGNSYTSAYGAEDGDLAYVDNMDNGSISSPASYTSTTSVVNAMQVKYVLCGDNKLIFSDGYYSKTASFGSYFDEYLQYMLNNSITNNTLEYYLLENENDLLLGKKEDYINKNVQNKIVVVKRGEITFTEKLNNAKEAGAIGIIVINTSQATTIASLDNVQSIPFALASSSVLEILRENAQNGQGELIFDQNNVKKIINESSSQGVLEDLSLGVDLAAFGTNINSLGLHQSYAKMTGTSMAAPNAAGAILAVKQYLQSNAASLNIENLSKDQISSLALKLLMSNTTILTDIDDIISSPRVQGAGLINLNRAINSLAYISVEDKDKTKIEIKEDLSKLDQITLEFDINNLSDISKTYSLSVKLLTEKVENNLLCGKSQELTFNIDSIYLDGIEHNKNIIVSGKTSKRVTIKLSLSQQSKDLLNSYEKGNYIDGYVILDGASPLSCPFIGYYGNWENLEILDKTAYEINDENNAYVRASTSYGIYAGAYYMPLGQFAYKLDEDQKDLEPESSQEYAALSIYSSAMYSLGYIQLGLLRNAEYISIEVINNLTQKVIYTSDASYVGKTAYLASYSMMYGGDLFEEISPYSLGLDNNTNYTVKVNVYRLYNEGQENSISGTYTQDFVVDFEAPVVEDIKYSQDKKNATLTIYDNHYPQALLVCSGKGTTATNVSLYVEKVYPIVAQEAGDTTIITVNIEDALKNASNGYLYYYVVDYAFNYAIYYDKSPLSGGMITTPSGANKPSASTDITTQTFKFKQNSIIIDVNEEVNLTQYLNSYDIKQSYNWSLSNKDIIALDQGKITGLSEGVCVVNVENNNQEASIIVKVVDDIAYNLPTPSFEGAKISGYTIIEALDQDLIFDLDIEKEQINLAIGEAFKFNFEYLPYNYNYIQNPVEITIEKDTSSSSIDIANNIIRANEEGKTTITIKAKGMYVKTYIINVSSSLYIDDNKVLKACFSKDTILDLSAYDFIAIGANAFYYAKYVEQIILPTSVKVIYEKAFYNAKALQSIDLKNVEVIYKDAFEGCISLKEIDIKNVKQLSKDAFKDCVNLNRVYLSSAQLTSAALSYGAFNNCERLQYFNVDNVDQKSLILNKTLLITLDYLDILDKDIEVISANSFSNIKLSEIDLTNLNIKRIEKAAFSGNKIIENVKLPASIEYIGPEAFSECESLSSVNFNKPTSLYIGDRAFAYSAITNIDLTTTQTKFGDTVFLACSNLQYANLGIVQDIGRYTFALADMLTYVEYEEGSVKIGENTFALCIDNNKYYYHDKLTTITIPNSIQKIDDYAFAYCRNLDISSMNLSNITEIGEAAFYGANVNSITLSNVEKINYAAFAESSITKITMLTTKDIEIGELAFYNCQNLETVVLPTAEDVSIRIEKGAFYECINLSGESIKVSFMSPIRQQYGINLDRVVYVGDYAFYNNTQLDIANLKNVEYIGYAAFANCSSLKKISISSVKHIDDFAFYAAGLENVTIPTSVQYIGQSVFNDIDNINITITEDEYPNMVFDKTSDGYVVIYTKLENNKLMLVYYPKESKDKSYIVKENTSLIGSYAFYEAENLTYISMNNIEYIGHGAFYKCSSLKCVNISGSVPALISSYNDDSLNTYCNFVEEIDQIEGLILVCDSQNEQILKGSKIYSNYFEYIVVDNNVQSSYANLGNFIELLNNKEVANMSKDDIANITQAYNQLSNEEKEAFTNNNIFSDLQQKYRAITETTNNNSTSQNNQSNTIGSIAGDGKSLLNMSVGGVVACFAAVGILILAITVLITWYFAKRAMNKNK